MQSANTAMIPWKSKNLEAADNYLKPVVGNTYLFASLPTSSITKDDLLKQVLEKFTALDYDAEEFRDVDISIFPKLKVCGFFSIPA